ncbi:MAG TPA: hypothetical protein VM327_03965 [Candidatus Thermoplasmatota archaeon]|nr:hypothetical protein [Candidatus Thermoplasmatota archaeon]
MVRRSVGGRQSVRGRHDGDAAVGSSVIAFLVAGVLFMASVVAVLVTTRTGTEERALGDAPEAATHLVQADSLAGILLGSPGFVTDSYQASYAATHSGSPMADWSDVASQVGKTGAADNLTRLGLLDAQSPVNNMLDYAKFQNLRAAPLEANAHDGLVNYDEALAVLGLDTAGVDFHIRAYPALQSVSDLLACQTVAMRPVCKDPNLKVAYIGDIQPPAVPAPPTAAMLRSQLGNPVVTCSVSTASPKAYTLSTTVTNGVAGNPATQFNGVFLATFSAGPTFTKSVKTPVLAGGASSTLSVDVPYYGGRRCGTGTNITVDLYDPSNKLLDIDTPTGGLTSAVPAPAATSNKDLWLDSATYFVAGSPVVVNYDGSELDSRGRSIGLKSKPLYLEVRDGEDPAGTVRFSQAFTTASSGRGASITITPTPGVGVYTARLYDGSSAASGSLRVASRLIVVSAAPGPYVPSSGAGGSSASYGVDPLGPTPSEVYFLDSLIQQFCPTYYDTKTSSPLPTLPVWDARCAAFKPSGADPFQPGDVFPDAKNPLRSSLVPRLICQVTAGCPNGVAKDSPRYDLTNVLVVGTNVDHNEMAPAEIKYAIEDWVKGGGTLIVLGSVDQSVNWLMPILKTGIKSSSGGVSVPDAAHPVLHVPDELDYAAYKAHDQVWDFRGSHDADELFTQIVAQGDGTDFEPILAVSNPGSIQDADTGTSGTVILTTWRPYDLFDCGTCSNRILEGQKFLNNVLMLGYGDLYLDYGPAIPPDTNVVPAVRFAQIQHPQFADPIQLKMNVFVFSS